MKAVLKTERRPGIEVRDVPVPKIQDTDFLVRIKAASICGSDVHAYEWTPNYEWMPMPVILGHEFAGEVVEVGSRVKTVKTGDRITAIPAMACSRCEFCQVGRPDLCRDRASLGLRGDGAMAEYLRLTAAATTFPLPEGMTYETASLTEPLAVVIRAVDLAQFRVGQTAAVLGPGPIGLLAMQLVRLSGASTLLIAGTTRDAGRLAIARELGADITVDVNKEDPVKKALEIKRGGLDVVFEASGNPASVTDALNMVKPGGKVVLIGIHPAPAQIQTTSFVRSAKTIIGAYGYDAEIWNRALTLMNNGQVKTAPIITHVMPFQDAKRGFELLVSKEATKVILTP